TLADPEKGSGIAMVCTFGDLADVTWWRELELPTRPIVGWDGRITSQTPPWITTRAGKERFAAIAGATSFTAKQRMVEVLRESGDMMGEPKAITHPVKFFEKGDKPLEIVTTRQWYISNGGRDPKLREELLTRGREITWHPPHMLVRYENWVGGLNGDWLISRQRFFGVPVPIWYVLDSDGNPDYERVLAPSEAEIPIDPSSDVPAGYTEDQRNQPSGFMGDPDVMDTWATSSLTPQIAGGWERDPDLFKRVFPMDMRPQAHEIIRTWLFSSVVRADLENNELPWQHATISGWILDPDRKKMSKSKGNVVTPMDMLDEYSSDAVRYWAASGRPGTDTAFDVGQMKIGRRLAIKLLNASKFALTLSQLSSDLDLTNITAASISEPVDQALIAKLAATVESATKAFEEFNYAKALDATETFFWEFTDDYVELVKERAYGERGVVNTQSARATLLVTLDTLLRLFAPFLPFTTEETWSWFNRDSIHTSQWPDSDALRALAPSGDKAALATATEALRMIRKAKSEAKLSMRAVVSVAVFTGTPQMLKHLDSVAPDLKAAGSIEELKTVSAPDSTDLQAEIFLAG
ncbi:MAG: valine--tRNA ligase, partial [Candidatus Nanopelagicales bacterium]|nr:valine--tRNA ligase [Candidatus Nanopelagicales bacterium]